MELERSIINYNYDLCTNADGPQNISYVPVKSSYEIGDRLTCYSDASPLPTYKWRILSASLEYISQTFTVTEAMVGDAVFICEISNMIATANIYINTTVNRELVDSFQDTNRRPHEAASLTERLQYRKPMHGVPLEQCKSLFVYILYSLIVQSSSFVRMCLVSFVLQ